MSHILRSNMARLDDLRIRQQAIGVRLRQHFDTTILEPVPAEWLDLLRKADAR